MLQLISYLILHIDDGPEIDWEHQQMDNDEEPIGANMDD
jgi:hypothetical protein